jgi:phosphonate transport system ATP-binding protein
LNALLELSDISISYGGRAILNGVSVSVRRGERVALVGRSGAGKSTLLRQLYTRQPGQAALVPQDFGLVKTLSVFHNIYMGRLDRHATWYNLLNLVHPLRREVIAIRPVAERLGLEDKLFAPAGELSGGQQQRTAVARALHRGGDIVFADEPVSALDQQQARRVLGAMNERFETVVLVMHDLGLALEFTERVIGLDRGGVVLESPTAGRTVEDFADLYRGE